MYFTTKLPPQAWQLELSYKMWGHCPGTSVSGGSAAASQKPEHTSFRWGRGGRGGAEPSQLPLGLRPPHSLTCASTVGWREVDGGGVLQKCGDGRKGGCGEPLIHDRGQAHALIRPRGSGAMQQAFSVAGLGYVPDMTLCPAGHGPHPVCIAVLTQPWSHSPKGKWGPSERRLCTTQGTMRIPGDAPWSQPMESTALPAVWVTCGE